MSGNQRLNETKEREKDAGKKTQPLARTLLKMRNTNRTKRVDACGISFAFEMLQEQRAKKQRRRSECETEKDTRIER